MSEFNHLDDAGAVRMVDVGEKSVTRRVAVAEALVTMEPGTTVRLFSEALGKGDALATIRIAAIQAVKKTPDLIPLCHPIAIDRVEVEIERTEFGARIQVLVGVTSRTGVEMEAMTGAVVGALALYDMVKGIERGVSIDSVRLLSKTGGKSGEWRHA